LLKQYPEQLQEEIDEDALREQEDMQSLWEIIDGL